MIIIRILVSLLVTIISFYFSTDYIVFFTSMRSEFIVVDGMLNIWASISGILLGLFFLIYYVCFAFGYELSVIKLNKIALCLIFVVSPLSSVIIHHASSVKVENYSECKDLREISSRYSSRTYAISPELCDSLKQ